MLPCLITHTSLLATNADATRRNHVTSDNLVWRYVNHCINFWQYLKWPHVDIKTALVVSLLFSSSVCVHVSTVPLSKKTDIHFQTAAQLWRFSLFPSFLPPSHSCVFLSSLSVLPPPSSPHRPCWIGGVNTGRERALFHHARAGAGRSCRAPAPGSKVYCGFHFTFPQPITEPYCRAWTLTPAKNSTQKMVWRQIHNCTPSHLSFFPILLLFLSFNWPVSCVDRA